MFKHPFHEQAFRADMQKVVPASPIPPFQEANNLENLNVAQAPRRMVTISTDEDGNPVETAVGTHAVAVGGSVLELIEACRTFCARVEAGEVHSVRTYSMFKTLLARIDGEIKK